MSLRLIVICLTLLILNILCVETPKPPFFGSYKTEIIKCKTSKQVQSLRELTKTSNTTSPVIVVEVQVGGNFTYKCCDTGNIFSIYRFGLYEKGGIDPTDLICRAETNKIHGVMCSLEWGRKFSLSRYHGRVQVRYNTTDNCMLFTIRNVDYGDENNFSSTKKDVSGGYFKPCTPIELLIKRGPTTTMPTTNTPTKLTSTTDGSSTKETTTQTTTTEPQRKEVRRWSPDLIGGVTASVIGGVALFIIVIIICVVKRRKNQERRVLTGNTDQNNVNYGSNSSIREENIPLQT